MASDWHFTGWLCFFCTGDKTTVRTGTHQTALFLPRLRKAWLAWRSAAIQICLWSNRSLHLHHSLQSCQCSQNAEGKVVSSHVTLNTNLTDIYTVFHTFPTMCLSLGSETKLREIKTEPSSMFFNSPFGTQQNGPGLVSIAITLKPAAAEVKKLRDKRRENEKRNAFNRFIIFFFPIF